jgi:serine/threonine-protein kinase RsbW
MARTYRRQTAAKLQELLGMFDGQEVPLGLLDYWRFRESYRGLADNEVRFGLLAETERMQLPQVSYSTTIAEYYPPIRDQIDPERTALGTGFTDRTYTDDDQIAWLAAEIESKLEADLQLTETWLQRLETAATESGIANFRIWLVAPEGFSPESQEFLSQKNAIGSSRRQVDLLRAFLTSGDFVTEATASAEYEITIPVGDEEELIAAHALEEIAKRHQFQPKSINQIKTALIEACINAAEHSHSPDRKIYQRFSVHDDRIVITVSNRGIKLTDRSAVEIEPKEGRRGWGLNLIRGLMDEVKIEQVDDGTRISMTKFLLPSE